MEDRSVEWSRERRTECEWRLESKGGERSGESGEQSTSREVRGVERGENESGEQSTSREVRGVESGM
jgi:hypothetical protein